MVIFFMENGSMDWKMCNNKDLVKEIKVDRHLINSLIKSSANKFNSQLLLELNEETASSKISLAYESLRMLLEALAISKGYKIYNHECYCAFLKEILNTSRIGDNFDTLRRIRNSINYYGKEVSTEEAKDILIKLEQLIDKIKKMIV